MSAGFQEVAFITGSRDKPSAKYFIGSGKADEINQYIVAHSVAVVIFNHDLTPSQERNLERLFKRHVLDRSGLILDIFAKRARTFEGKLQVERAQVEHQSTRLVRGWTHLERQKGGIGVRGGPGETQLEVDRRLLAKRLKTIDQRLEKVRSQRKQSRRSRERAAVPLISLVGYTNAGKSSLFNRLTASSVYVADKLFATLDPTLRKLELTGFGHVILADTVGFIRKLPHSLIDAFHATLEETVEADLLLHVVDAADDDRQAHIESVETVLNEIGATTIPQLQIYNKVDLIANWQPRIDRDEKGKPWRVSVSAATGAGMELLAQAVMELLSNQVIECAVIVPSSEGKLRAALYALSAVQSEDYTAAGDWRLQLRLSLREYERLRIFKLQLQG